MILEYAAPQGLIALGFFVAVSADKPRVDWGV
jgi:hypothetical protein